MCLDFDEIDFDGCIEKKKTLNSGQDWKNSEICTG